MSISGNSLISVISGSVSLDCSFLLFSCLVSNCLDHRYFEFCVITCWVLCFLKECWTLFWHAVKLLGSSLILSRVVLRFVRLVPNMPLVEVIWALLLRQRTRPYVQYITRFFCCGLWTRSAYCFPVFSSLALGNFLSSMQWDFFMDFWSSFSVCLSPSSTSFSSTLLCIFYRKRT